MRMKSTFLRLQIHNLVDALHTLALLQPMLSPILTKYRSDYEQTSGKLRKSFLQNLYQTRGS